MGQDGRRGVRAGWEEMISKGVLVGEEMGSVGRRGDKERLWERRQGVMAGEMSVGRREDGKQ